MPEEYGLSDRAIQIALNTVYRAYPWLEQKLLKVGTSSKTRYTALAQRLIAEYRISQLSAEDWIDSVWQAHPEESASFRAPAVTAVEPDEVLSADAQIDPNQADSLRLAVMGVGAFVQQQQQQGNLLELNQQVVDQLAAANAGRFAELQQFFAVQQQQRQTAQTQRQQQLQQEGQNEAIEEFLVKQGAKNDTLAQLESLNSLGKLVPFPDRSAMANAPAWASCSRTRQFVCGYQSLVTTDHPRPVSSFSPKY